MLCYLLYILRLRFCRIVNTVCHIENFLITLFHYRCLFTTFGNRLNVLFWHTFFIKFKCHLHLCFAKSVCHNNFDNTVLITVSKTFRINPHTVNIHLFICILCYLLSCKTIIGIITYQCNYLAS